MPGSLKVSLNISCLLQCRYLNQDRMQLSPKDHQPLGPGSQKPSHNHQVRHSTTVETTSKLQTSEWAFPSSVEGQLTVLLGIGHVPVDNAVLCIY